MIYFDLHSLQSTIVLCLSANEPSYISNVQSIAYFSLSSITYILTYYCTVNHVNVYYDLGDSGSVSP